MVMPGGSAYLPGKAATDQSYLACARRLLAARPRLYPQFASHNALTVATIIEMAGRPEGFEFQRLHGMGEALYEAVADEAERIPCRIYAPVGGHRELLAYLVRRLLEGPSVAQVHPSARRRHRLPIGRAWRCLDRRAWRYSDHQASPSLDLKAWLPVGRAWPG